MRAAVTDHQLRDTAQRPGQRLPPRVGGLLAVGLPPRRYLALALIPDLAMASGRPERCRMSASRPVDPDSLHDAEHVVKREPRCPAMRFQCAHLCRSGI